jgi:cob(I)alamin adenosyltransferase
MSIYTKAGDKGKTSLFAGKIVSKASTRVNTYGTLDELNSFLGVVLTLIKDLRIKKDLTLVQNDLFEIGAALANPNGEKDNFDNYLNQRVLNFEKEIDKLTNKLPQINHFILPGGRKGGASLHFARTLTRRAERRVVELSEKEKVNPRVIVYLNRLSDLLFTYARMINSKDKKKEVIWSSRV